MTTKEHSLATVHDLGHRQAGGPGLPPGENRLLEFVDPIVATLQAKPAQLQQHSTGRRVNEVVSQRYLDNRPWAFRDGDEPRRVRALQLVQPHPVDRHDLVGVGWGSSRPPAQSTTGVMTYPDRVG